MEHKVVGQTDIDAGCPGAQVGGAVDPGKAVEVEGLIRHPGGDALVDHVDRAADRLAAVKQHGRAAQHFDALDRDRFDGGGVIDRGVGNIRRAHTVDQHAHALALLAAQHRARGAGGEAGGRDAGQFGEQFADLTGHCLALDLAHFEHAGAGEHVQLLEPGRADDDGALTIRLAIVQIVLNRWLLGRCFGALSEGRGSGEGDGEGAGKREAGGCLANILVNHGCSRCVSDNMDVITYHALSGATDECKGKSSGRKG